MLSYPVYDGGYEEVLEKIKTFVNSFENFQTIGRNGLHRYNNQDHATLTGMFAVRNAVDGESLDLWSVNADQEYHEEIREEALPESQSPELDHAVAATFTKLDRVSGGLATGVIVGTLVMLATLILTLTGGDRVGPNLTLLNQYLPGCEVTVLGSVLGLVYGFMGGFVAGWIFAFIRNAVVFIGLAMARRNQERRLV